MVGWLEGKLESCPKTYNGSCEMATGFAVRSRSNPKTARPEHKPLNGSVIPAALTSGMDTLLEPLDRKPAAWARSFGEIIDQLGNSRKLNSITGTSVKSPAMPPISRSHECGGPVGRKYELFFGLQRRVHCRRRSRASQARATRL